MLRLAREWLLILRGHGWSSLSRHVMGVPWLGLERGARAMHYPRGCLVTWGLCVLLLLLVRHLAWPWHGNSSLGQVLRIGTHLWGHCIARGDGGCGGAWGRGVARDRGLNAVYGGGGRTYCHRTGHNTSVLVGLWRGKPVPRNWRLGRHLWEGSTRQTLGIYGSGKLGYSSQEFRWREVGREPGGIEACPRGARPGHGGAGATRQHVGLRAREAG